MNEEAQSAPATDGQQLPPSVLQEAQDTQESEPASADRQDAARQEKQPTYQDRVDLSGLPEDIRIPIEGRITHLTKLMGKNERKYTAQLSERDRIMADQARIIEELQSGVGAVVDHLQDKSLNDAEADAKRQLRIAHETNDTDAFISANDRLAEIKARKVALEQQKKQQKPAKETQQRVPASASQIANDAMSGGEINQEDAQIISAWQEESDDSGNLLRPWAHARTEDPKSDPRYVQALINAQAVWSDPRFATTQQRVAEMDRIMGTPKRNPSQNVMGGQLTTPRKSAKLTISPEAQKIAIRTKFGGPKAKSDADHIEAYRKQIEKYEASKTQRGSRK